MDFGRSEIEEVEEDLPSLDDCHPVVGEATGSVVYANRLEVGQL